MAAKSKGNRQFVRMKSSESAHCYFTTKNRNNTKEKLELLKFDPTLRKHVKYKEQGKL